MTKITLLTTNQVFGNNRLKIFEKNTHKAAITDFSIILGGDVSSYFYIEIDNLENRTGWYWTTTYDGSNDAHIIDTDGFNRCCKVNRRTGGARLTIPLSEILSTSLKIIKRNDTPLIEYGEYPQQAVSTSLQITLENLYKKRKIKKTKKTYTTDSINSTDYYTTFKQKKHIEYEYNGKKYIRITNINNEITLSNGETYHNKDIIWIEVQPIKWLIDEHSDIAITEKIIFSGIQFNNKRNYKGNFIKTDINLFIDKYFSKDIISSKIKTKETLKNKNFTYNLQQDTRNPEIVDAYIEYKPGINITLKLPSEILNNTDTLTIQSLDDKKNQSVYVKKR